MRASCTCADPASKQGRCKHGVALLLRCKKEKNVSNCKTLWTLMVPVFLTSEIFQIVSVNDNF